MSLTCPSVCELLLTCGTEATGTATLARSFTFYSGRVLALYGFGIYFFGVVHFFLRIITTAVNKQLYYYARFFHTRFVNRGGREENQLSDIT